MNLGFLIQVDTLAHKIPNFIEKAARAGCKYAFIGLESINPDNLAQMKKSQNRITEYRKMFQAWKNAGTITYAGFILGLPGDTPAGIRRDIEIVQKELPVDLLEFTLLTPLPGSEDHQKLFESERPDGPRSERIRSRDRDRRTSAYEPGRMAAAYWDAWNWYYTDEHVERLMRRNAAYGLKTIRILRSVLQVYGAPNFEGVHPQQCGYYRRKVRKSAGPNFRENPRSIFYPPGISRRRSQIRPVRPLRREIAAQCETASTRTRFQNLHGSGDRSRGRRRGRKLEMFDLNASSRAAVEKARRQAQRRRRSEKSTLSA